MDNSTSEKYGQLYVFFLEVCRSFIDNKLHVGMGVPEDGEEMYAYLDEKSYDSYQEPYEEIISSLEYLSEREKEILRPSDGIIKVENLDFVIYLKIIRFLGRNWKYKNLSRYMIKVRNHLCHIPVVSLRREKSQNELDGEILQMRQDLEHAGISRALLYECEMRIFNRIARRRNNIL